MEERIQEKLTEIALFSVETILDTIFWLMLNMEYVWATLGIIIVLYVVLIAFALVRRLWWGLQRLLRR